MNKRVLSLPFSSGPASPRTGDLPAAVTQDADDFRFSGDEFNWDEDLPAALNYQALGQRLAGFGDVYRDTEFGFGLLVVPTDRRHPFRRVASARHLAALIVDRVPVRVFRGGKPKGSRLPEAQLNTMLAAEAFLSQFSPLDGVLEAPGYLPDFQLTTPGYNDGGPGHRLYYRSGAAAADRQPTTVRRFLDVMEFKSQADRTNAVAAALTVMFRNHFPGAKPLIAVTATKSHAGKGTIVEFAAGCSRVTAISYQSTDWALERSFVGAMKHNADTAVLNVDNARLDRRGKFIASAFLERFVTDPEPLLFSTGSGGPTRRRNDLVVAITTNFGSLSEDLMNRALPVHLEPAGDITKRKSPIGNPKLEFLPNNREQIEAELRGMIEIWKDVGRPLSRVRHPFASWAATIGGILKVNGFDEFLANYKTRQTADDPLRRGLALLGAVRPDEWLRGGQWAALAVDLGLVETIVPPADRGSEKGRERGMGVVMTAHRDETLHVETDDERLTLRLEKARRRFTSGQPSTRYRFVVLGRELLPEDDADNDQPVEVAT